MADNIELTLLGFASVVDTVLLLAMLERVNRPLIPIWIAGLLAATWTWHVGSFVHVLMRDSSGQLRYAVLYIPVLLLIPVSGTIFESGSRDFLLSTTGFHLPYLIWLSSANVCAAGIFWSLRNRLELPGSRNILLQIAGCLVIITGLAVVYAFISEDSTTAPLLRMVVTLSLSVPAVCFAWSIFHRRLIPIMLERTLVYGAILVAMLLFHRMVITPVTERLTEDLHLDFVLIEFVAVLALVLAWRPLRNRVRETLQYLLATDIAQQRDATRQLSSRLLVRSNDRMDRTASWFAEEIRSIMGVQYVWLGLSEHWHVQKTDPAVEPDAEESMTPTIRPADVYLIPFPADHLWIDQTRCRDENTIEQLRDLEASAVFRFSFRNIDGRLLLGSLDSTDRFSTEQLNSLALLLDQFAVTVHNRELEEARQLAERRAMQQEKLSVLGLMSGSLAHELRNPLSSIKTISTLVLEDLDESSSHRKDMELIVSEIDRLTETANGLLQYSRPADTTGSAACVELVIERLLKILRYLAQQHDVKIVTDFRAVDAVTGGNDATLSEIFFNLVRNAIEAATQATESGHITITTASSGGTITVTVSDNGPGIPPELRDHLFEPFVTGKDDGTGLGLYLVAERVQDLGGSISCDSEPGQGTVFQVQLPAHQQDTTAP